MVAVSERCEFLDQLFRLLNTHAPSLPQVTGNCTCPAGKYANAANNCVDWWVLLHNLDSEPRQLDWQLIEAAV